MTLANLPIEGRARQPGRLTRRLALVLREYRPGHNTQSQLGFEWGIGRSAVAMRYLRARRLSGMEARRPATRRRRRRRRIRVQAASLSSFDGL